jgi:hypothetical protein
LRAHEYRGVRAECAEGDLRDIRYGAVIDVVEIAEGRPGEELDLERAAGGLLDIVDSWRDGVGVDIRGGRSGEAEFQCDGFGPGNRRGGNEQRDAQRAAREDEVHDVSPCSNFFPFSARRRPLSRLFSARPDK